MTTPLRAVAVVAALLASGFTAEHLASPDRPVSPSPAAVPLSAPPDPTVAEPLAPEASPVLGLRLPMGPVQGPVSSPFGPRVHPVSGRIRHHDGVDLAVPAGTAVWTVAPGTVRSVGRQRGYGLVVEIDHPQGIGRGRLSTPIRTRYAHLASVDPALQPGSRVGRGVALGASGGRPGLDGVSTGAHLHFEVRDASGQSLDPAQFVRLSGTASGAPRWTAGRTPAQASGDLQPPPTRSTPRLPDATAVTNADSLAPLDLPEIVLPDYPSLPALTGPPSPLPPLP